MGRQAHKPAITGESAKAIPVLVPQAVVPAMLEVLVGRDGEQHQDEQRLAEGELAASPALTIGGEQVGRSRLN